MDRERASGVGDDQGQIARHAGLDRRGGAGADGKKSAQHISHARPIAGAQGLDWQKYLHHKRPVPVLNDAHAALLGEAWRGAARGVTNVILLTLGTGVGGAALIDGQLLRGHLGRAGHLGHMSVNAFGRPDIVGTPGSLEDAIGDCTLEARSAGRFTSTSELLAAVKKGDARARRVWADSGLVLAVAVNSFINLFDPELVVVGGGIANAGNVLFRPLKEAVREIEWQPGGARARVVPAELGAQAGAFGAAWKALQFSKEK